MELDMYTRIGLILAGLLLIVFMNVDMSYVFSKILFWKNKNVVNVEKDFIAMVNMWYKLRNMCETHKMELACAKLDEVFPLLNDVRSQS
jgi:hypothetical protein